jgi:serine/threonine protein kinase
MPEREGQRIGNYHLHRLLGKGSFAEVYLGEHLYLRNSAAIKILRGSLNEKDEYLFLSEAQTVARLAHPNIVRVREFAIERSIPFLAMDYAPGGTLRHRYPEGTCLSLEQTVTHVKYIAAALQYAHNRGIIHRDVKPENVLQGSEHAMLSDFGISVQAPRPNATTSQEWAGTFSYMAPEQFQSKAVFASDQYALAIMTYEWLCGVRPFEGSSTSLAYQHGYVSPPPLRDKDPSLPEAVEIVVLKALSKAPEDRYVSVLNFARALERASRNTSYDIQANAETVISDAPHQTVIRSVFLSHAALDDITRLQTDLSIRDLSVQDDPAPEPLEEKTRQAIRAAQVVLLVLTPQTRSSATVKEHLRIAGIYQRKVLCVWAQGDDLQNLLPVGAEHAHIIDARGQRYKQALDEIIISLERERRGVTVIETPLPLLDFEPRNPYKGLRAFTQYDRADFFGRETVVRELLARLKKMDRSAAIDDANSRFLAVVGPSGSGKSSIVMAGLLPKIQDGALPGSEAWVYLAPMVPGKQPLEALVHLLAARFPEKGPQAVREVLRREGGFGLHQLGLALVKQPEARVVVTIDQFEELFSSDISEQERQLFIQVLVTAATEPRGSVLVLLTLRADFYDRPFAYPALGRLVQQQQCAVLPMSVEDLRNVIERPASLPDVRLLFDEDLVGDLLFDMRGQAGALPLLEFALDQLFYHRREHRLTRYAYQEIGGVRGALSKHAESTYQSLPSDEHRRLARTLFVRLIQPGEHGQEPIRRRAETSEFALEDAEQTRLLHEVINVFTDARLIIVNQFIATSALEISHEALIREWTRLATWLQEAREDIHLQQIISNDVIEWERRGKPKDRLYRGSQLKESLAWRERNTASGNEAAFLRVSAARRTRGRINMLLAALMLLALLIPLGFLLQQQYAPSTVTTLKDDAPGSLRQVIANARPGSTIFFDASLKGAIILNKTLVISKDLTLRGPDVNELALRGTRDQGYLIYVPHHSTVTISQLTFSDPIAATGTVIQNEGTLTLNDCHIIGNSQTGQGSTGKTTGGGGGIKNNGGVLTLQNSIIAHNTVNADTGAGGGIVSADGTLVIKDSQIVDNTVVSNATTTGQFAAGGGISSSNSKITVINSIIARNRVIGGQNTGVAGGAIQSGKDTVVLMNSAITDNSVEGNSGKSAGIGGGIASLSDTITISGSRISGNTIVSKNAVAGGAVGSFSSRVTIDKSMISNNSATGDSFGTGGALTSDNGRMAITNTTVSHNALKSLQDIATGGGIYSNDALAVTNSVVSENSVNAFTTDGFGASGGGIDMRGTLTLKSTTLSLNTVTNSRGGAVGGGLFAHETDTSTVLFSLTNCTIANNKVQGVATAAGGGLALHLLRSRNSRIDFCTIYGNTALQGGGMVTTWTDTPKPPDLLLKNSIIAGNYASTAPDLFGVVITGGYNLVQRVTDARFDDTAGKHNTDLPGDRSANPGIDPQLRNHGGSTLTLALQADSPAVNAIPTASCDVATDQRGVKRPQNNACDIGAYEYD